MRSAGNRTTLLLPLRTVKRFALQRYDVPFPKNLTCGSYLQKMTISLPYNATKVHTANLKAIGTLVTSGAIIVGVSAEVIFYVNGQPVGSKGISNCSIPGCQAPFDIYTNIMGYIHDGDNDFLVEVRQSWSPAGCVTGVNGLEVYIELDYTGEPPPPPKPTPPAYWGYVKWGLVGLGAIAVTYAAIRVIPELRKKG